MDKLPLIAHRGYPALYPENTRIGLEAALKAGADFIEFDVQLSSDRVPLLLHDVNLKRTTGFNGRVTDIPYAQIDKLCAGEKKRFGNKFLNESIPTLKAAIELIRLWPNVTAFVEIKPGAIFRFGVEQTVDLVLKTLEPVHQQCVIISSHMESLLYTRNNGLNSIGWIFDNWTPALIERIESLAPDYVFVNYKRIPNSIEHLSNVSWQWALYEISDPELALSWFARGADLIETNMFEKMRHHLMVHYKDNSG